MVALGNFQRYSDKYIKISQTNSQITYDTFTDTGSLSLARKDIVRIYESHNLNIFSWRKSYIIAIFQKAYANRYKADYFVFLLQEEIYLPSQTSGWQKVTNDYKKDKSYSIEGSTIHTDKGEIHYFNDLLRAWHKFCWNMKDSNGNIMKKKVAYIGCPRGYYPTPSQIFTTTYGSDNLKYIAGEYDMVYIYRYPTTLTKAKQAGYRASDYIKYWKNTLNFKGKINYILDTQFNNTSISLDTIREDFRNATNAGAHIISAYPYTNILSSSTYTKGAPRLIEIRNWYNSHKSNGF